MAGERLKEVLRRYRKRYAEASRQERTTVLNEFCRMSGYHRKYAILLLGRLAQEGAEAPVRRRGVSYSGAAVKVVEEIWRAAGYPWSERLKALLPLWLPWARRRLKGLSPTVEAEVLRISARQIDRRLAGRKRRLKRRLYGRTKPGTLLKHQIPIQAGPWEVAEPGHTEVDLVSHSGPSARGEFAYTLNLTDVYSGWCESRAVLGRSEEGIVEALDRIRRGLPFPLRGIDSDNGSEFINFHLLGYCQEHAIRFTRGRPYQKDDNARVEQKNWTHVRRIFGWERYDREEVIVAMNDRYAADLRVMMNLFQPSVKLRQRQRVGARLRRRYEKPKTPLDRLVEACAQKPLPGEIRALLALRERTDPFELAESIGRCLERIERLQAAPPPARAPRRPAPLFPQGGWELSPSLLPE